MSTLQKNQLQALFTFSDQERQEPNAWAGQNTVRVRTKKQAPNQRSKALLFDRMQDIFFLDTSVLTIKAFVLDHYRQLVEAHKLMHK